MLLSFALTKHEFLLRENVFGQLLLVVLLAQFGHVLFQLRDLVLQVLDHLDATLVLLHLSNAVLDQVFLLLVENVALTLNVRVRLLQPIAIGTQGVDLRVERLQQPQRFVGRAFESVDHLPDGSSPCSFVRNSNSPRPTSTGRVRERCHRIVGAVRRFAACTKCSAARVVDDRNRSGSAALSIAECYPVRCRASSASREPERAKRADVSRTKASAREIRFRSVLEQTGEEKTSSRQQA